MDDIEWTLLRGPASSNRLGLEPTPDLLGRPIRQSSRTATPAGSRRRSPADSARNSPVSPPATASHPAKQVRQTRDHEHAGARDDSSMAIRRPQAASESWAKFSPQDDRNESGRHPGDYHLPFATERSPRAYAIRLALSAMRTSIPTPSTVDSAASPPLRYLSRIVTGAGGIGQPDSDRFRTCRPHERASLSTVFATASIVLYLLAGC